MTDLAQALGQVSLFSRVKGKDLKRLANRFSERNFSAGEKVIEEGQSGLGFFLIEEGSATVSVRGDEVRKLGPGECFGEVALIDEGPRSATVTADTDLHCRAMAAWEFRSFIQEHPEVAWPLLQSFVYRLREAESKGEA